MRHQGHRSSWPGRTGSARPASTGRRTTGRAVGRGLRRLRRRREARVAARRRACGSSRSSAGPSAAATTPTGHGNSVPRFHITWGTGPGSSRRSQRRVREGGATPDWSRSRFRHRVTGLATHRRRRSRCDAARCSTERRRARARASSREVTGDFELTAQAVIVTSGGIGGNHDLVRAELAAAARHPARAHALRRPGPRRRADARRSPRRPARHLINRDRMWHYTEGIENWNPIWAAARHPDPARPVLALVRRPRQAAAGTAVPRLRHAGHARTHHDSPATTTPGSCSTRRSSRRSSRSPAPSRTRT